MSYPKLLVYFIAALMCASLFGKSSSGAPVQVKGYTRKDGTYVAPHVRSAPNSTKSDNYSTKGNVNPYTGKAGTKSDGSNGTATTSAETTADSTKADVPTAAETSPAPTPALSLSLVTLGMSKTQVLSTLGEPNLKSDTRWFYMNRGWVRFKGDQVSSVEAKP